MCCGVGERRGERDGGKIKIPLRYFYTCLQSSIRRILADKQSRAQPVGFVCDFEAEASLFWRSVLYTRTGVSVTRGNRAHALTHTRTQKLGAFSASRKQKGEARLTFCIIILRIDQKKNKRRSNSPTIINAPTSCSGTTGKMLRTTRLLAPDRQSTIPRYPSSSRLGAQCSKERTSDD